LAHRRSANEPFYALKNVSFSVAPGESLGVLGANGAGKTTLLTLVAGISSPDEGGVFVRGSVAPLLELAAGFHQDLTGTENVLLYAALLGLSRKTTMARFDEIVEFSGVGDFIDEPLRTYSTGMRMRLAFAVAVTVDPEVLLIDEAFAVGDQEFQAKCVERIAQYRNAGKTLLCVSHSPALLRQFCDHGIWLEHGELMCAGGVSEVIEAYQDRTGGRTAKGGATS
jgi:ABC-type polysaccharide/polyol phosphate transport system ATPase subunit